ASICPPRIAAAFMLPDLSAGAVQLDDELKIAARNQGMAVGQSDGRGGSLGAGLPNTFALGVELGDQILAGERNHHAAVGQNLKRAVTLKGADGKALERPTGGIVNGETSRGINRRHAAATKLLGGQDSRPIDIRY